MQETWVQSLGQADPLVKGYTPKLSEAEEIPYIFLGARAADSFCGMRLFSRRASADGAARLGSVLWLLLDITTVLLTRAVLGRPALLSFTSGRNLVGLPS